MLIDKLRKILISSKLDYARQVDFSLSLAKLDEKSQKLFISLLEEDSGLTVELYELLQKKKLSMQTRNKKLWQEIIKEEIELINRTTKD